MNGPYTTKAEAGKIQIFDSAGSIVEDPAHQSYWDYETSKSLETSYYFTDMDRMIEHFKKRESLIYVTWNCNVQNPERSVSNDIEDLHFNEKYRVINVPKGVVQQQHPDFTLSGFGAEETNGLSSSPSKTWITEDLWVDLNKKIQDDAHPARKISTWPIERSFVYFDVSDFSRMLPGHQALVINSIVHIVQNDTYWAPVSVSDIREDMDAKICIGDGYIFVFRNALKATRFAAYLAQLTEHLHAHRKIPVEYHFRIGVHVGRVYCFWDPGRNDWNYIGDGINGGQRVLGAVGKDTDDVMFVSAQVRQKIASEPDSYWRNQVLGMLHNRGRKADKHGNPWRVYEVSHTGLMSHVTTSLNP